MKRILYIAALSLSVCATAAIAADGYVTGDVELRAGPDPSYPSVSMLNDGTSVSIMGCVDNWSWCDVATSNDRGWVPGDFLQEEYQGQRVFVPEYALEIGIPIVTFEFGTYWNAHYHNRPFYAERQRYIEVRPQYRAPAHRPHAGANQVQAQRPGAEPRPAGTAAHPAIQSSPATVTTPTRPVTTPTPAVEKDTNAGRRVESQQRTEPSRAASEPQRPVATESHPVRNTGSAAADAAKGGPKPQESAKPAPKAPEHEQKNKDKDKGGEKDKGNDKDKGN
jgi:uncharacterized protein YraI